VVSLPVTRLAALSRLEWNIHRTPLAPGYHQTLAATTLLFDPFLCSEFLLCLIKRSFFLHLTSPSYRHTSSLPPPPNNPSREASDQRSLFVCRATISFREIGLPLYSFVENLLASSIQTFFFFSLLFTLLTSCELKQFFLPSFHFFCGIWGSLLRSEDFFLLCPPSKFPAHRLLYRGTSFFLEVLPHESSKDRPPY